MAVDASHCARRAGGRMNVLSSLVESGGLIDIGAEVMNIRQGDLVPFLPYESLMR